MNLLAKLLEFVPAFRSTHAREIPQRFLDKSACFHAWIQRRFWALKNELDVRSEAAKLSLRHGSNVFSANSDFTGIGLDEAVQAPSKCGLSTPAFANEADALSRKDVKGNILKAGS
ncbi:MAG: hypothetical protein WD942_09885 [Dehalococcoidia bacterium]